MTLAKLSPILVANRGEIASRIAQTCKTLGLEVVGVYTAADCGMPHPQKMDRSQPIGDYLNGVEIIQAAHAMGARSVHPGFGFLAENAEFAQQVVDAGLIWIGPRPESIRVMGSKRGARQCVAAKGVSVVPGYDGDDQSDAALLRQAEVVGFPLLVKASAGGGGKGMAVVQSVDEMLGALEQARRVSLAAFGDDQLLLERFVEGGRHVEIQVLADSHGHVATLLERECSIQRRRQKIVEEAPSPAVIAEPDLRRRLCADAVRAAHSVNYEGAGTVEFMVTEDGQHFFLEMNTRLQVEHPVTEAITGLDLVEQQLRVATGASINEMVIEAAEGHAIEVRIYAENPDRDYLPDTGTILAWSVPQAPGVRVDSGVSTGVEVGIDYDPMLAKVIAHGDNREQARLRLLRALRGMKIHGLVTNREQLIRVLDCEAFILGQTPTSFLDDNAAALTPANRTDLHREAGVCATILDWASRRDSDKKLPCIRPGFRSNPWPAPLTRWQVGEDVIDVAYRVVDEGEDGAEGAVLEFSSERLWTEDLRDWMMPDGAPTVPPVTQVRVVALEPDLVVELGGIRRLRSWSRSANEVWISGARMPTLCLKRLPDFEEPGTGGVEGGCVSPMPGKIVKVAVSCGQQVEPGDPLVVLEAMKMEQVVRAPLSGQVVELYVEEGQQVDGGAVLLRLEASE